VLYVMITHLDQIEDNLDSLLQYKVDFLRYKLQSSHIIQQYEDDINSILAYYHPDSLLDIGKDKLVFDMGNNKVLKIHDYYPIELTLPLYVYEILYPEDVQQFGMLYASLYPKAEWVGDVEYDAEWANIQAIIPNIKDPHHYNWGEYDGRVVLLDVELDE